MCLSQVSLILSANELSMKTGVFRAFKGMFLRRARLLALCMSCTPLLPWAIDAAPSAAPVTATAPVVEGQNGWLFLGSELRFLGIENFWVPPPKESASVADAVTEEGPLPAIVDFDRQLRNKGVRLILLPVPPKALISKHASAGDRPGVKTDALGGFYRELGTRGVEVLDLRASFATLEAAGQAMYCKSDSHWSGLGCVVAAQLLAEKVREILPASPQVCVPLWTETSFLGDLAEMRGMKDKAGESLPIRQVSDANGNALASNKDSPLLLIGDSHTLVFKEFLGQRAGLADQLAFETGTVPEVIGTRGSGANAVRVSLSRRNLKDPHYLASKKVLVWCFAAREFTEADQGWQKVPLIRPEVKVR